MESLPTGRLSAPHSSEFHHNCLAALVAKKCTWSEKGHYIPKNNIHKTVINNKTSIYRDIALMCMILRLCVYVYVLLTI